ncbi:MAG: ABC transporter permease [Clostridia bacterium]|nr:ABC transporter permease [Clostridia bacterium]
MKKLLSRIWLVLILVFLYAPIIVLIVYSFNSSKTTGHWTGFSLNWYRDLVRDRNIINALVTTVEVAVLASLISTVIGTVSAIALHGSGAFSKRFMLGAAYLPMLNPDIVTGVSLMILFGSIGMSLGFGTMMLSHISFCVPYVILSVLPKLYGINSNIFEAALDLGSSRLYAYRKVVLPEIVPGIISGFVISMTLSIDDFMISYFNTGGGVKNLSILIYGSTRTGVKPVYNALSAIMFLAVLIVLVIINVRKLKASGEE